MKRMTVFPVLTAALMLFMSGCGGGKEAESLRDANQDNLQRLANLYVRFQQGHQFKGPSNKEEFETYIRNVSTEQLEMMGITSEVLDSIFVDEETGSEFKIRWEVMGSARGSTKPVIFCPSMNASGKYRVGFTSMTQKEVDKKEYDEMWEGKHDSQDAAPSFPGAR